MGRDFQSQQHPVDAKVPTTWNVEDGTNILWSSALGSESYGNPVVANGKVFVGTNNGSGYLTRYPTSVDLGVLVCFDEKDGKFLWQHSSEKLPTGRVHDWPDQGICCAPMIDGDRGWFVTSRGEVVCFDLEGFKDKENDGPFKQEAFENEEEADVVWKLDMMKDLKVSQHNMCSCSVTAVGDYLFVNTSNGVDESHITIPERMLRASSASAKKRARSCGPTNHPPRIFCTANGRRPPTVSSTDKPKFSSVVAMVGSIRSIRPVKVVNSKLLWKFDCNPKASVYTLNRATRNHLIATPVIYDGLVYIAVGEDPEHGEGQGHLWCIDPKKRGDVSPTIVYNSSDATKPVAHKRLQALVEKDGDFERDNPNSAAVWHYVGNDPTGKDFEQTMHRTCGTAAIKNDLLFIADFSGVIHCIDVKSGKAHWTHDMLAASWASGLIAGDNVYFSDEDGDISIFKLSAEKEEVGEINMGSAVFTTPIVANDTLYIANRNRIFAIKEGAKSEGVK